MFQQYSQHKFANQRPVLQARPFKHSNRPMLMYECLTLHEKSTIEDFIRWQYSIVLNICKAFDIENIEELENVLGNLSISKNSNAKMIITQNMSRKLQCQFQDIPNAYLIWRILKNKFELEFLKEKKLLSNSTQQVECCQQPNKEISNTNSQVFFIKNKIVDYCDIGECPKELDDKIISIENHSVDMNDHDYDENCMVSLPPPPKTRIKTKEKKQVDFYPNLNANRNGRYKRRIRCTNCHLFGHVRRFCYQYDRNMRYEHGHLRRHYYYRGYFYFY